MNTNSKNAFVSYFIMLNKKSDFRLRLQSATFPNMISLITHFTEMNICLIQTNSF